MATRIFRMKSQLIQSIDSSTSIIKSKLNTVQTVVNRIELPDRFKGTIVEKWAGYWKNLSRDYRDVAVGVGEQIKQKPLRSAVYGTLAGAAYYCAKHNPDERDFAEKLKRFNADLVLVHESCQNPSSAQYVKFIEQAQNAGIIRIWNFGVVSFMWLDNYDEALGVYKATCTYLQSEYLTLYQRIIDVGFLDKWWKLEQRMIDFDINEANL